VGRRACFRLHAPGYRGRVEDQTHERETAGEDSTPAGRGLVLLSNPESGSGAAPEVERLLRSRHANVISLGLDELDRAARTPADRYVVAGGDGSIGSVAALAARARVPLAVVPVGTANDFARALRIPLDSAEASTLAAAGRRTRRVDLAWIDGPEIARRPFLNAASVGLSPVAARKAGGLKRALGPLAYALGAARAGITARPIRCRLTCDGEGAFAGEAWQVTVAGTGAFGGGAELDADPGDGRLDALVIEAGSRASLAIRAYGMRAGSIASQRGVRRLTATTIELEVPPGTPFNVDGELIEGGPARLEVEPRAVEVVAGE
jgi:diacylglycerol kinase (ATP)